MMKTIDLEKSVYELVRENPEIADILAGLGFSEIHKKAVLNSVGKLMTIPKGAKFRKVLTLRRGRKVIVSIRHLNYSY